MQARFEEAMQELDQKQAEDIKRPSQERTREIFQKQESELKDALKQCESFKAQVKSLEEKLLVKSDPQKGTIQHSHGISFGNEKLLETNKQSQLDDLVAHFEQFNMEDLQGTGQSKERKILSPDLSKIEDQKGENSVEIKETTADFEQFRKNVQEQLNEKKVRLLELEAENGELKSVIEQMTNDVKRIKSAAN